MSIQKLSVEIDSNFDDVKDKINIVLGHIEKSVKDADVIFELRTILTELIVNGVVHGNSMDLNKKVYLDMNLKNDDVTICVRDEGQGFEYCEDAYNVFDMKTSGRGLVMVNGLCDEFNINNNEVFVKKTLKEM